MSVIGYPNTQPFDLFTLSHVERALIDLRSRVQAELNDAPQETSEQHAQKERLKGYFDMLGDLITEVHNRIPAEPAS